MRNILGVFIFCIVLLSSITSHAVDVTYGTASEWALDGIGHISIDRVDTNKIVICYNDLPATNNIILDSIMGDLFNEIVFHPANPKNIKEEFENLNLEIVNELNFKGYFVIMGKKK